MPPETEALTDPTNIYSPVLHEDMQEIISHPPAWLVRWGTLVLLLAVSSVLLLSYLVRYPERLVVPAHLLSATPPLTISAQVPGRMAQVLVHDKQVVAEGQVLGYLQTTAAPEQVQQLRAQLTALRSQLGQPAGESLPATLAYDRLGELERSFIAFKKAHAVYELSRHPALLARRPAAIAPAEAYVQALDLLRQDVAAWLRSNALLASAAGQVHMTSGLSTGLEVRAQQPLFYLVPAQQPASLYGELVVTQAQAAALRTGQSVALRFAGYQASDVVLGRVGSISEMPTAQGTLRARVDLPVGLQTTNNQCLTYRVGMSALAEVTVSNPRLLARICAFIAR